ncbi:MAG: carbohydrate ABC transporter permease [Actinobacteria bacterium]|nr:carbohydrate ABC transporter permease [Actinomycetota bacterium]
MDSLGFQKRKVFHFVIYYFLLIVATLIIFMPILWMISVSLRPNKEVLLTPPAWIPQTFTIEAYRSVLINPSNIRSFLNSLIVSLSVTGLSIILASLASYGFSRFRFRGKTACSFFILVTQMIPPIFLLLPYFIMMSRLGLYDTYLALIITFTSFTLPFCTLMLRSYFDTVPREIDEAALIDGCSWWQALIRVILPINIPAIIATGAFAFILAWTELLFAVALTQSKGMRLFTVALSVYIGEYSMRWNELMAFSVLACIPLVIGWVFLQKYIIEGMTAGAIKY